MDKYLTHSDKFEKKKVTDPNGNFSLFVPKGWEFEANEYPEGHIFLWSTLSSKEEQEMDINRIQIIKAKDSLGLKEQYDQYINKKEYYDEIIDSGETNFLNYPSYFTHIYLKKSINKGIAFELKEKEIIRFFLKSKQEDVYYYLFLTAIENENQQQNMSMMLHCLKTFEILK